ncbi:hypothetical protein [Haloarchaeobius sp. FL176]|uniref:hypothetical protein n=1 Tax=Haloarchaeobius sp. FL176 TaxID=2967129 RepID=UPI0021485450|nr:hypothetical protein [Haloarchaeobius sp. FL176]
MALIDSLRRSLDRARDVERFVRFVVAGGLALVAGLWLAALSALWSLPWAVGVVLSFGGVGGLAVGIRSELVY